MENKKETTTLDQHVIDTSLLDKPFLHRTANVYKWCDALSIVFELYTRQDFHEILDKTIVIPPIGMYEYNFDFIYKYPGNLFDFVIPVEVSYKFQEIILLGVKNDKYYKVYVTKNNFIMPLVYEMEVNEYIIT